MRLQDNSKDEFDKDYSEAVGKLNQAIKASQTISKAIEEKLNEREFENLMVLMRKLLPMTIQNLGTVYSFLHKYESKSHAAEIAKDDLCQEQREPKQE